MGADSAIEWTDHTWNPWMGCDKVSPGCEHCYMFTEQKRYGGDPGVVRRTSAEKWRDPLRWLEKQRRRGDGRADLVFTCSWSDFFHEAADAWRAEAWNVIRQTSQPQSLLGDEAHLTYLILTKRPERMFECLPWDWGAGWPNVWLGVTAEDQERADERIPMLLQTPAEVHFVTAEPMVGAVDLRRYMPQGNFYMMECEHCGWLGSTEFCGVDAGYDDANVLCGGCGEITLANDAYELDWVICGGESGTGARPLHPQWARSLRDQCVGAGVPFFFKQWGEWEDHGSSAGYSDGKGGGTTVRRDADIPGIAMLPDGTITGKQITVSEQRKRGLDSDVIYLPGYRRFQELVNRANQLPRTEYGDVITSPESEALRRQLDLAWLFRVGKKAAGRVLDGRTWDEYPASR